VSDKKSTARYEVGALIKCISDMPPYYGHFLPYGDDEYEYSAIYGIIVRIEYAMYSEIFGYEILYVVLGIDGKSRYFSEDEIIVIS
jgi:hypothetical protein|tara:strand:- start:428 stop:685 length:258 start_codon:yes stop_codon:yes gene_type:complete